jgi:hypothetical protein
MRQDAEWRHVRPPLVALNNEQSDAMRSRLPELAFAPTGS